MKILIFASPRSGSTALIHAIAEILNLKKIIEPFNPNNKNTPSQTPENSVTKIIAYNRPIEFFQNYINKFDKIIFLTRNDIQAAYESYIYAYKENRNTLWHKKYTYNESIERDELRYNFIETCSNIVKEVAKLNKKSYLIYEELYSKDFNIYNKAIDKVDFDIDRNYLRVLLDPKNKLRQVNKTKTLI